MNVFVYRRTHVDDPCEHGNFGVCDCMGSFRDWDYDAVIGIGGENPDKGCEDIAYKITWVGIGANKHPVARRKTCSGTKKPFRGSLVTFRHFCLLNNKGSELKECAPKLAKHMFKNKKIPRSGLSKNFSPEIQKEVFELIKKYEKYPQSKGQCKCGQS